MSDRLAVFNEGRIEQVGTPAEVYERPENEFVAGFVGVSNVSSATGAASRSGRRRSGSLRAGDAADGLHVEDGHRARRRLRRPEHALRGRRSTSGGELIVIRQNLETSHDEARDLRGRKVRVGWRPEQTFALDAHATSHLRRRHEEDHRARARPERRLFRTSPRAAVTTTAAAAARAASSSRCPTEPIADSDRRGRGQAEHRQLGRLRRGRLDRQELRLGHAVREGHGLPGQLEGREHLRRDGDADAHRPLRRRLGLRQRVGPPDRRRRRAARSTRRSSTDLAEHRSASQEPALQLGRRPDVRRAARLRSPAARLQHEERHARARQLGGGLRPDRTRARSPSTTTRSRSPTRRSTCRRRSPTSGSRTPTSSTQKQFDASVALMKKQRPLIGQYWADVHQAAAGLHAGRPRRRVDLAVHGQPAGGRQAAGQDDPAEGGRDRLVGHVDAVLEGEAPELHAQVDELDPDAGRAGAGRGVVRRGAGQPEGVRPEQGHAGALRDVLLERRRVLRPGQVLGDADAQLPRRPRQHLRRLQQWVQAWTEIKG